MAIKSSSSGRTLREYSIEQLKDAANRMRGYDLVALCAAGSGHAGGTLSIMDITAALYLKVADHDPENPSWSDRDRIIWSTGHKAPSLYLGLAFAGFCPIDDVVLLRKLSSPYQGHPHWLKLPGVEVSTGSLGQGLSIAVGIALAGKLDKKDYRTFCSMGDGEQQEGQIWEAAMEAGHHKLDSLIGIIDYNQLQIDGWVRDVMNVDPLAEKYRSFGWEVLSIDGHDMRQVVEALDKAKAGMGKPVVIIAATVKGKGVSFIENVAGWHGRSPNYEEMTKGLAELGLTEQIPVQALLEKAKQYQREVDRKLDAKIPHFSRNYWWNAAEDMKATMEPTRKGFKANPWPRMEKMQRVQYVWGWTFPARSRSATSTMRRTRSASTAGSAWESAEQSATSRCGRFGQRRQVASAGHLRDVCRGTQFGPDSYLGVLWQFQRADCWRPRWCFGGPGRCHAPGSGRPVCHVRIAEYVSGRSLRCDREFSKSYGLPAAQTAGAVVHPLRARGDSSGHLRTHAVRVWPCQCHPLPQARS